MIAALNLLRSQCSLIGCVSDSGMTSLQERH